MGYDVASNLLAARSQMAFTLGFHIILACLGVGLPTLILIANAIGLRRGDSAALLLAQRWSTVMAVTFAVGAVTGTVWSFEMGWLWPVMMGRFGGAFGIPFAVEGPPSNSSRRSSSRSIFDLAILWTAFPPAFAAIMSTLFVPFTLAALGIVLRGAAFAFRPVAAGLTARRAADAVFAISSILTPFVLGAAGGAIASGRVPAGNAAGDPWRMRGAAPSRSSLPISFVGRHWPRWSPVPSRWLASRCSGSMRPSSPTS